MRHRSCHDQRCGLPDMCLQDAMATPKHRVAGWRAAEPAQEPASGLVRRAYRG